MKKIIVSILFWIPLGTFARVVMPHIFSDNMVLQRDIPLTVWGWADRNEKITLTFNGQIKSAKANEKGQWQISLNPMKYGGPFEMVIKGTNEIVYKNVLIGEVWIASGQSNMEFMVRNSLNAEKEIAEANYPEIRHIDVPNTMAGSPREDFESQGWQVCTPENAGSFTAVGYFFARHLYQHLHIPVGIINASWGGTNVEAWMSTDAYTLCQGTEAGKTAEIAKKNDEIQKAAEEWRKNIERLDSGFRKGWERPSDVSEWMQVMMPGIIENQINFSDGVIWLTKEFWLSKEESTHPVIFTLGEIDDNDQTFVNGHKIGETKGYNVFRRYEAMPEILQSGKNIIVIRIEDTGGRSGISCETKQLKIITFRRERLLSGDWYAMPAVNLVRPGNHLLSPNNYPSCLYNGMIHPLIRYAIRGVIWYQGEANAGNPDLYAIRFPAMITDWRKQWGLGDFPFLFVQLANFEANKNDNWPGLREAQLKTLSLPNTGMAVTIDIGDPYDIHPRNKQEAGYRLSLAARKLAYGENITYSGPLFKSVRYENGKAMLEFDHIGSGLSVGGPCGCLCGFEIAGNDNVFVDARAEITDNRVVVWNENVKDPVAVRYGWANSPRCTGLYNKEGLPASPFRTKP